MSPLRHLVLVLSTTILGSSAHAQTNAAVRAQTLFDRALALVSQNRFKEACPLFRASLEAERRTGTAINLAVCYEKTFRMASAWAVYRDALALAQREGNAEREDRARQKIAQIEPQLARLTIRVNPTPRYKPSVFRDDAEVPEVEWGVPVPVDQGEHTVRVEAAGRWPWQQRVRVDNAGETKVVIVPSLQERSWWSPARTIGVPVASVGVATLATGLVLGLVANGTYADARSSCPNNGVVGCAAGAEQEESRARGQAAVSTALTIGGAALSIGGAALILLGAPRAPRAEPASREVSLRLLPGGVQLAGRFD